jgi:hypothetical protein
MTTAKTYGDSMKKLTSQLLIAAAVVISGCSAPELIDRTQPNYVKKADLLSGTWYIKESIIDVPKTSNAATIGYGGNLEKIRWEIHEDMLVGYRSYEFIPGIDPRIDQEKSKIGAVVFKDGRPFKGSPVVAYKISGHFDRQRQYNAATGEQTNILVEDTADRPWYQREYMRVEWAKVGLENYNNSLGADGQPAPGINTNHGLYFRSVTAQSTNKQDNEFTEARNGAGELTYFDFTTELLADPPTIEYPGYGTLPYCMVNPTVDCETALVRVRTSVKKVDEARVQDYEPLQYGEKLETKFGFFRQEMLSYNKGYGYTESGRLLYAMRHNIWDRAKNDKGETIPVTQRGLRPIVYFMSANTPKELFPAAKDLETSWDHAFRRAVAVPRGIEISKVPQMFFVCANPVPADAPPECGKAGTYVRVGDIRYNMIPYVEQITGGLLGLGPSSIDPETGEVVQAVANVYGPGMDTWTGNASQVLDVLNGDVKLEDIVAGKDIKDYVFANLNATDPRRPANGPWNSAQPLVSESTRPMGSFFSPRGEFAAKLDSFKKAGHLPLRLQDRKAVVEKLIQGNPALESELINLPEIRAAVISSVPNKAFQDRLQSDSAFYKQVALQTMLGTDPVTKYRKSQGHRPTPEIGCPYSVDFFDDDYVGIAKQKQKIFNSFKANAIAKGDPSCAAKTSCTDAEARVVAKAEVWNDLRRDAYRSVGEHEVGHTLGLMHNFIGSADPLNYKDGYWDLRKETIGVNVAGKRVLPITPQNLIDAAKPNQKQIDNGMYELQYSTIMDYGARMNADIHGIGKYDEAAILFGYAGGYEPGWVEVFNEMPTDYDHSSWGIDTDVMNKKLLVRGAHVEIPLAHVEHYTPVNNYITDRFHYTTLPFMFADKVEQPFETAMDKGIARMNSRSFRKWSEMEPVYARVASKLKEFHLSQTAFEFWTPEHADWTRARDVVQASAKGDPVEVPYMFCSDYEVGANVLCNTWDEGADLYEMTSKWVERFDTSYVWTNFRRDRFTYSINTASASKGRYLDNIPNVYQQWLFNIFFNQDATDWTTEEMDDFVGAGDPIWQNYWTMAVTDSTNLLMRQLSTPSAGYHGKLASGNWVYLPTNKTNSGRLAPAAEAAYIANAKTAQGGGYTDVAYVPRGPGRSMFSVYDTNGFDNFTRINEVGHFWDQVGALSALTTSETNFLGVDRGSDALKYSLPYYITFNRELAPLFRDVWSENRSGFASGLAKLSDGTAVIAQPTPLHADSYILGFNYPPPSPTPVDGAGNALTMEKVEASPSWSTRFYTQVWGMAYFTDNFNQEYASFNQIYKLGSGEALQPTDNYTSVTFPDPGTPLVAKALPPDLVGGYVYAGLKQNTGPVYVGTPAAVMLIDRANLQAGKYYTASTNNVKVDGLSSAEWEGKLRETVRTLEIMRGLYDVFGRTW